MKHYRKIIASLLIVFYMLSMAHTLFHNHLHSSLAHYTVVHTNHACGCSDFDDAIDHHHQTGSDSTCNLQTQFVPTDQKPRIEVHSIDISSSNFIIPLTAQINIEESVVFMSHEVPFRTLADPQILYHSLRAPPAHC